MSPSRPDERHQSEELSRSPQFVPTIKLTNWPLLRERRTAMVIVFTAFVVLVTVQIGTASWLTTGVTATVLALSSWRLWLPVSFEFGPSGLTQRVWRFMWVFPWIEFSGYQEQPQGVLLLPRQPDGISTSLGSLYVSCPDKREEVVTLLDYYLSPKVP